MKCSKTAILSVLLILVFSTSVFADEVEVTPVSTENVTTQPTTAVTPAQDQPRETQETVVATPHEVETETTEEAATFSPVETSESTSSPDPSEESFSEPLQTEEPEEELEQEVAISLHLQILLDWIILSKDDSLRLGDEITLQAEITPELDGLRLQWQVATKAAESLKEDEPEWADISGAHSLKYKFAVKDDIQTWRWRLCVTAPEGESTYSDEIMLPAIEEAVLDAADGEIVPEEEPLPVAYIIFAANAPVDEIIYGTEIQLTAEIENPREGMLLQWQHMPADAELEEDAWVSVEGAAESIYAYVLDEENEGWLWRLLITVPEAHETNEAAAESTTTDAEEGAVPKEDPPQEESVDDSEAPDEAEIAIES